MLQLFHFQLGFLLRAWDSSEEWPKYLSPCHPCRRCRRSFWLLNLTQLSSGSDDYLGSEPGDRRSSPLSLPFSYSFKQSLKKFTHIHKKHVKFFIWLHFLRSIFSIPPEHLSSASVKFIYSILHVYFNLINKQNLPLRLKFKCAFLKERFLPGPSVVVKWVSHCL